MTKYTNKKTIIQPLMSIDRWYRSNGRSIHKKYSQLCCVFSVFRFYSSISIPHLMGNNIGWVIYYILFIFTSHCWWCLSEYLAYSMNMYERIFEIQHLTRALSPNPKHVDVFNISCIIIMYLNIYNDNSEE